MTQAPPVPFQRSVNGITLHGVEAGPEDGPLVILLHGFPEFWWGWRHQIEALAEAGFRVVAPDQRGYNLSSKPQRVSAYDLDTLAADVVGLARAFGRERFRLAGHDWGGLVAWWVATRHPQAVERLVILNAPHPSVLGAYLRANPSQLLKSAYVAFFQLPRLPEFALSRKNFQGLRQALADTSRPGTFSQEDLERYAAAWAQPGALTGMLNWYRALPRRPRLTNPRVTAPTLVLWGMRDRFMQAGIADMSLQLCERGRRVSFDAATHWLHLEEPEAVSEELTEFFKD